MKRLTEHVTIRLRPEELEHLKKCSGSFLDAKFSNGKENFSGYLRTKLLEESKYQNSLLERQVRDVRYELRKIGTNVNQIAKKINSGFGTLNDLQELERYLADIEGIFSEFGKEVDHAWQSQS